MSKPDVNFRSYANEQGIELNDQVIDPRVSDIDSSLYDDIFKLSRCKSVTLIGCKIRGGGMNREDGVDINNECGHIAFHACDVEAGAKYAFTIKGGSYVVVLSDVVITRPGKYVDIDLGNWSDQSCKKTDAVILSSVTRSDGKPVRVRVGHAQMPVIKGGNIKILRTQSILLKAYVYAKMLFAKKPQNSS